MALGLAFAGVVTQAHGQGAERFRLRWVAVPSCPSQQEIQAETERLLGGSRLPAAAPTLDVDARVSETSRGFDLQLTLGQGAEARVRSLTAPSCLELGHATALVIALALDPSLQTESAGTLSGATDITRADPAGSPAAAVPCSEPASPARPTQCLPAPQATCPRCLDLPPAPPKVEARASRYALLAGTSIAYGALPQALPRVSLGAGYRGETHWLELSAEGAFASHGPRFDGGGATFVLALASPRYCVRARVGSISFGPCGILEVGALSATGFGVTRPNTQLSYWVAAGVGIQASVPLAADTELRIGGELLIVATRTRFELDSATLYRPNLAVPAARLSLAAGFL
jgi:hypothetical protein